MQSLVSKASEEVKELRQSIDLLKSEVERMEVKYISTSIEVVLYILSHFFSYLSILSRFLVISRVKNVSLVKSSQ